MKELSVINIFVGGWLIFTSWIMPGGVGMSTLTRNEAAVGVLLIVLAGWTVVSSVRRPVSLWLQMVAGAWLIAAPFVFRYSRWNDVACGVLALAIALSALSYWTERTIV